MSVTRRNSKRKKNKKIDEPLQQVAEGFFVGLDFVTRVSDIVDKQEVFTINPNILIKDNTVIVDYGEALKSKRNKRNQEEIKTLFEATAVKGDTLTLTNGEYLNELEGDRTIYDLSGTYEFLSFDDDTFIVILNKISINNESSTYNRYGNEFFINGSLQWTVPSTTDSTKTEKINELVNLVGNKSTNSFSFIFKTILPQDIIELKIDKTDISSYTIISYSTDSDGIERIELSEDVPTDKSLFGNEIFAILKRKPENILIPQVRQTPTPIIETSRIQCPRGQHFMPPNKDFPEGRCMDGKTHHEYLNNKAKTSLPKSTKPKSKKMTSAPSNTSKRKLQSAAEKWRKSGKRTFTVHIENNINDSPSYIINGKKTPTINLESGKTYRFNTSHTSNGTRGYTNSINYFIIGTNKNFTKEIANSIVRSSSKPGNRGSYLYFTAPAKQDTLYYTSKDKSILGLKVVIWPSEPVLKQTTNRSSSTRRRSTNLPTANNIY